MGRSQLDIEKEIKEIKGILSSLKTNKKSIDKLEDEKKTHDNLEKITNTLILTIYNLISKTQELKSSIDSLNLTATQSLKSSINLTTENQKTTKTYTTSTRVINITNINLNNSYTILRKKGSGIIRELKIISKSKYNIFIKLDKTEIFNTNSSFDDLILISKDSDNIIINERSDNNGNKLYITTIKNISFIEYIEAAINFNGNITINNIFCIYDIKEI